MRRASGSYSTLSRRSRGCRPHHVRHRPCSCPASRSPPPSAVAITRSTSSAAKPEGTCWCQPVHAQLPEPAVVAIVVIESATSGPSRRGWKRRAWRLQRRTDPRSKTGYVHARERPARPPMPYGARTLLPALLFARPVPPVVPAARPEARPRCAAGSGAGTPHRFPRSPPPSGPLPNGSRGVQLLVGQRPLLLVHLVALFADSLRISPTAYKRQGRRLHPQDATGAGHPQAKPRAPGAGCGGCQQTG